MPAAAMPAAAVPAAAVPTSAAMHAAAMPLRGRGGFGCGECRRRQRQRRDADDDRLGNRVVIAPSENRTPIEPVQPHFAGRMCSPFRALLRNSDRILLERPPCGAEAAKSIKRTVDIVQTSGIDGRIHLDASAPAHLPAEPGRLANWPPADRPPELGRILLELEDANAFVVSLDPERTWFRYHHLFADLLRLELRRTLPEEMPALHRRAAGWFSQRWPRGRGHPAPRGGGRLA